MRKLALILLAGALTGCTTSEVDQWLAWWHDDPEAATDFANQDWVQRSLEWGCVSYCDVDDPDLQSDSSEDDSQVATAESSSDSGWTDETATEQEADVDHVGGWGKWDPIIECESGGDWSYNGSSGYDGALQFHPDTWDGYGGDEFADYAYQASPSEQIAVAERVLAGQGWGAWPTCAARAGYL